MIIGGVLFGAFAGYAFWFPKAFGFTLDERLGKAAFWCWVTGFYVAFVPLYVLGFEGMTRRMQHYDRPEWHPWVMVAGVGALLILCGIALQIAQLWVSVRGRAQRRESTGDPWDGRSLEWATASPPPIFNFAVLPTVTQRGALLGHQATGARHAPPGDPRAAVCRHRDANQQPDRIRDGVSCGGDGVCPDLADLVAGRCLGLRAYVTFVVFAWRDVHESEIPAEEVARIDRANRAARCRSAARGGGPMSTPALRLAHDPAFGPPESAHRAMSGHGSGGPAPQANHRRLRLLDFILSDVIMFSALFGGYAVLCNDTPAGLGRTSCSTCAIRRRSRLLLFSTFTCGMASLAVGHRNQRLTQLALLVTGSSASLSWRVRSASSPFGRPRRGPGRSAFLSAFFHPGGMPRCTRERRTPMARHDDGAVFYQGVVRRSDTAFFVSGCSGTRSTSSGWGS